MMSLTSERQGFLGDLMMKTIPQLKELLERQEKILSERAFLENLPDKGEKTKKFAEQLKQVIQLKCGSLCSAVNSKDAVNDSPATQQTSQSTNVDKLFVSNDVGSNDNHYVNRLGGVTNRDSLNEPVQQRERDSHHTSNALDQREEIDSNPMSALATDLKQISLSDKDRPNPETSHFSNSYERVIRKAVDSSLRPNKFMPNRPLHESRVPKAPCGPDAQQQNHERKGEESAVNPPGYQFRESKLISIEESVQLIEEQRARSEMLVAERAAQKLSDSLMPKMDVYSPSCLDMQYRDMASNEDDQDSDDDTASEEG